MNPKEEQFISYWTEKRKEGRWWFAFHQGVLPFAWPVYLGSELFKYYMHRSEINYHFSWPLFLSGLAIWTILGMLAYAFIMWRTHEKRYQNLIRKDG